MMDTEWVVIVHEWWNIMIDDFYILTSIYGPGHDSNFIFSLKIKTPQSHFENNMNQIYKQNC